MAPAGTHQVVESCTRSWEATDYSAIVTHASVLEAKRDHGNTFVHIGPAGLQSRCR